jgi:signal transduction histidine kinase
MSNYSPALKDFVERIPICELETDLGNMLNIFQRLNCKMLAVSQGKLGWGILNSEDLLSLVTEAWLGDRIALTSHPRNIAYQQKMTCRLIPDIKTLIKPVTVYQGEIKLDEFLDHLQHEPLLATGQTCLIVNQQGELEGILDRDKIIQYLARKFSSTLQDQVQDTITDPKIAPQLPYKYLVQPSDSSATNIPNFSSELAQHQLLASVSHELKSPLTGIVGLSSLLQEQKLGGLNPRQVRYVELIYRSGKKMMTVIDDLLQLTALIADQPKDLESINLELLCRQLHHETLTKVQSGRRNLLSNSAVALAQSEFSLELDPEAQRSESFRVIANKSLLSSVLSYLMLEAIAADGTGEPLNSLGLNPLNIKIKSLSGMTAITITSQIMSSASSSTSSGLNLMIAKCLSEVLEARVTHTYSSSSSQLTLLLPHKELPIPPGEDAFNPQSLAANTNKTSNLTILCLYPELEVIDPQTSYNLNSNFDLKSWSDNYAEETGYQHRIIEADSLEQAHNLARIWRLDAIILNGYQIAQPRLYLRSLQESEHLATLPLITLDIETTEAANQIEGLNVYPCLLPAQQCNIADLIQVIQIAIES